MVDTGEEIVYVCWRRGWSTSEKTGGRPWGTLSREESLPRKVALHRGPFSWSLGSDVQSYSRCRIEDGDSWWEGDFRAGARSPDFRGDLLLNGIPKWDVRGPGGLDKRCDASEIVLRMSGLSWRWRWSGGSVVRCG